MTHRLLPAAIPALCLLLTACAATHPGGSARIDPQQTPLENVGRLAAAERAAEPALRSPLPETPPGIPRETLVVRPADEARARMTLTEAIADAVAQAPGSGRGQIESPADPAVRDEALRHYVKGRLEAEDNRHMVAVTELQKALELDPGSPEIRRELARSFRALGNNARAVELFEEIAQIAPDDPEAVLTVALAQANRRQFASAAAAVARFRADGRRFTHDPAAEVLADYVVAISLRNLGYDRASIEASRPVLSLPPRLSRPSVYARQIGSIYRQRAEMWREVGDAHCRLGEHPAALHAYEQSMQLPSGERHAVAARIAYAALCLDRPFVAQETLLQSMLDRPDGLTEADIRLCGYVARNVVDRTLLQQALRELSAGRPDDSQVSRALAAVLPSDEALELLRGLIADRPRDFALIEELLRFTAAEDVEAAVRLVVSLVEADVDIAGPYVQRLGVAAPTRVAALDAARGLPTTAARANVESRLLLGLGALGEAWALSSEAAERWPDDRGLAVHRLELAALLEEPQLYDLALALTAGYEDRWTRIVRARTARAMERHDVGVAEAERAVAAAPGDVEALTELARALTAQAGASRLDSERQPRATRAADVAEQAIAVDPRHLDAYEVLFSLYGSGGVLADGARFRETGRRLQNARPDSPLLGLVAAREAMQFGRFEETIERVTGLYETDPLNAEALRLAITAWAQLEDLPQAERWLERRLGRTPDDPMLLEQWVRVKLLLKREGEIIERLTGLIERAPDHRAARQLLETVYRAQERSDEAFALGEERLHSRPRGVRQAAQLAALYVDAGRSERARREFEYLIEHARFASADLLVGAVGTASRFASLDPDAEPLVLELVETTVARFPEVPLQVYGIGLRVLADGGEVGPRFDALADAGAARAAGAREPTVSGVLLWRNFAQALIENGHPAAAARVLRARLRGDAPLDDDAHSVLCTLIFVSDAAARDRAPESIALINALNEGGRLPFIPGMQGVPTHAAVLDQVSQIYSIIGDAAGARHLLKAALALRPDHAMALNNLGYSEIEAGIDTPEAAARIERAIALAPEESSILDTIGWLRYKQGRFAEEDGGALGLIRRSIERSDEPSAEVYDHLGDTYWRLGRRDEAADAWRRAAGVLEPSDHRERNLALYARIQTRVWGLIVADPEEMYDRDYGRLLAQVRAKLSALEQGTNPPVAPTFAELSAGEAGGQTTVTQETTPDGRSQ